MQRIFFLTVRLGFLVVATLVVIVAGMQRLVSIAHEMQQELQRQAALVGIGTRVLQFRAEGVDPIDHARVRRPV